VAGSGVDRISEHAVASTNTNPPFERHFSIEELAVMWGLSVHTVRRLFEREPDVVVFFRQRPGRRTYRTLRIPASVATRVYARMARSA